MEKMTHATVENDRPINSFCHQVHHESPAQCTKEDLILTNTNALVVAAITGRYTTYRTLPKKIIY